MAVKIRLMRIGTKKRPFYRVVACDARRKRTGKYLELLGTYNPLTEPHEIILKKDRIDFWIKQGAILSDGYLRMTKQAPQKPPRKPKKVSKQGTEKSKEEARGDAEERSQASTASESANEDALETPERQDPEQKTVDQEQK